MSTFSLINRILYLILLICAYETKNYDFFKAYSVYLLVSKIVF